MAKKKKTRRKATLSLTALVVILWFLNRIGVLTPGFWSALQTGNVAQMVGQIQTAIGQNFSGSGMTLTLASGISIAIVTYLLRAVGKGKGLDLRRPQRITV